MYIVYIYIYIYNISYQCCICGTEAFLLWFGSCQKILCSIEYVDWLKMHFPAWSNVFRQLCPINIWFQYLGAHSDRNDKKICLGMTLYIY